MIDPDELKGKKEKDESDAIITEAKERVEDMSSRVASYELAYRYYCSDQWLSWQRMGKRIILENIQFDDETVRRTANKIRPMVTRLGRAYFRRQSSVAPLPPTSSPREIEIARKCGNVNDYLWWKNKLVNAHYRLSSWVPLFGSAYWTVSWNADVGPWTELELTDEVKEKYGQMNSAIIKSKEQKMKVREGCPIDRVLPPYHVIFNPGATADPDTWTDFMVVKIVPLRWFKKNFSNGDEVKPLSSTSSFASLWRVDRLYKVGVVTGQSELKNWAIYIEWRIGPTKEFPRGHVVFLGGETGVMLWSGASEFSDGRLGIHPYYHVEDPFSPYGIGYVDEAKFAQFDINVSRSRKSEYRDKFAGFWMSPEEAGIKTTTRPGKIVKYSGIRMKNLNRNPLDLVMPPGIPPAIQDAENDDMSDLQDLASVHSYGTSGNDPRITSGLDFSLRLEHDAVGRWNQDDQMIDNEVAITEDRIWLASQLWPDGKEVPVIRDDGDVRTIEFNGSDVKHPMRFKYIGRRNPMATSQTLEQDKVRQYFMDGIFGDPRPGSPGWNLAVARYVQAAQLDTYSIVYRSALRAEAQAQVENEQMFVPDGGAPPQGFEIGQTETGEIAPAPLFVPVEEWQDHPTHIITHDAWCNSREFETASDWAKEQHALHRVEHIKRLPSSLEGQILQLSEQLKAAQDQLNVAKMQGEVGAEASNIMGKELMR